MTISEIDAIRTDGGLVHIRPLADTDRVGLLALNTRVSDRSLYRRFFYLSRHAADAYVERLLRSAGVDHQVLVGLIDGRLVGVASFERIDSDSAEFALLIEDAEQHAGIGTLLIEHLAGVARRVGVRRFVADVLTENSPMIKMIRQLGFATTTRSEGDTVVMGVDLEPTRQVLAAVDERDRVADAASLRPLLAPCSVAVIGAGDRPRSVGHEVLRNILAGGYTGLVEVVNPNHHSVLGVASVPTARDLHFAPDLAIVAVPAAAVLDVVRDCGRRGAHGILLLTAGFGETGEDGAQLQREVLAVARQYGMRLIGPNCLGLLNTDPAVSLNATFASLSMLPGALGLASQSGALGVAVLTAAQVCGLGVAEFVSVGNKADVSGNDLLLAWEQDANVSVIGLYLESFGNPRKFARIARRVSRTKPIIAIKAGRSAAGKRAGLSHTAAAAASDAVVDALFAHSGVLRVERMEQLLDLARLLSDQPAPAGPRVAIVGNSGGPAILATDAAEAAGLVVVELAEATAQLLRQEVQSAASCANPVDLGAGVQPAQVYAALHALLEADEVDAVLTVFTDTLAADPDELMSAILLAASTTAKTIAATHVGGTARSHPVSGTTRAVPVFTFPEAAANTLGLAYGYGKIRAASHTVPARPGAMDADAARALITDRGDCGWLGQQDSTDLLALYGITSAGQRVVIDLDSAIRAAGQLGYPVAVKIGGGVLHKTDVGGVRLGIADEAELRVAFAAVRAVSPDGQLTIQPMIASGTELIVGAVQDSQFGPLIMLGAGGVLTDLIADRQFRLAPLSIEDADGMIESLRCAPLLDGYRGRTAVSRPALRTLLLRVSALVDDLPELIELDLNPVVCQGDDLIVVDAKIRVGQTVLAADPVVRQLRC
jgi:acyl-CoA synthetase (NDP forming)/GNAT superfamily N-acetyltransferase